MLIPTVPIYDGRKRQLKVPDELRNIPAILPRYHGEIPYHSLVLVAYTISLYRAAQGSRKDRPTIPLNISFAVVLHDEFKGSDGEEDEQDEDNDVVEEDCYEAPNNQSNNMPQDESGEEMENGEVEDERETGDDNEGLKYAAMMEERSNDH
jgi:hypothetical protein